jgi:hypothetical protein
MDRRSFIATVAVTAVAAHLPTPRRFSVAIQDPSGAWALAPDGLVEVRRGQRFRILEPDTGALHFEAIADEDGSATADAAGGRQGQVEFLTATCVFGPAAEGCSHCDATKEWL